MCSIPSGMPRRFELRRGCGAGLAASDPRIKPPRPQPQRSLDRVIDMQKVKWLFFGYLALTIALVVIFAGSVALSRNSTSADPTRDRNTLYTIYASNVRWLDPAVISDTTSADVADQVFENLYNYDVDKRPYETI